MCGGVQCCQLKTILWLFYFHILYLILVEYLFLPLVYAFRVYDLFGLIATKFFSAFSKIILYNSLFFFFPFTKIIAIKIFFNHPASKFTLGLYSYFKFLSSCFFWIFSLARSLGLCLSKT